MYFPTLRQKLKQNEDLEEGKGFKARLCLSDDEG